MIEIKPIGSFFPLDDAGFVLNPTSVERLQPEWLPVIDAVRDAYLDRYGKRLHSLYIRGSVALGEAVAGVSDLDVIGVIQVMNGKFYLQAKFERPDRLALNIRKDFPFVAGLDLMVTSFDPGFSRSPRMNMVLKTQSLCVYGEDILPQISPFRPGPAMRLNLKWYAEDWEEFQEVMDELKKGTHGYAESEIISLVRQFLKVLLRTGFDLVMEREGAFTQSLYLCYTTFSKYYPGQEAAMRQALHLYLNPEWVIHSREGWISLEQTTGKLGSWMLDQVATFTSSAS